MINKRIAQTKQQQKSEKPQASGILQRTAVRSVADAGVQFEEQEALGLSNSAFSKDFSRVPISTTKPQPIMAKLMIGAVGDKYEQEADRVAAQVVQKINTPSAAQSTQGKSLQRQDAAEEEIQTKPSISVLQRSPIPTQVQLEAMPEDEELQAKSILQGRDARGAGEASTDVESAINSARGGGQLMADNIREPMEQAFGADFSGVKVHTDGQSDQLNQSIQSRAFTTGQDVFFRQGEYNPESRGGQQLLAHELTHVVQQNGGAISSEEKRGKKVINLVENTGHVRLGPSKKLNTPSAEVLEKGKGKGKARGEDYANHVEALLHDLYNILGDFENTKIEKLENIIKDNRGQCSLASIEVTGEDTNKSAYGVLNSNILDEAHKIKNLLLEKDEEYFKLHFEESISTLERLFHDLPTTAVDTRVGEVIKSNKTPVMKNARNAKSAIDDALLKLSNELKNRLKEYYTMISEKNFPKKNEPKEPPPGGGTGEGIVVN